MASGTRASAFTPQKLVGFCIIYKSCQALSTASISSRLSASFLKLKFMILSESLLCMFINLLHRRDAGFFGNTCRHMEVDAVFTDPRV